MRRPAHLAQIGLGPYRYTVPLTAASPAISMAFASACTTISYFTRLLCKRLWQSPTFFGKPLNPNATNLLSALVMTAPILLLGSFDQWDICIAMVRYRRSQLSSVME